MKPQNMVIVFCLFLISCESSTENIYEGKNHITASYRYNEIEKYAKSLDSGLKLKSVSSSNVNYDGTSSSWSYKYSKILDSAFTSKHYYFSSFYELINKDSIVTRKTTVGDAFISQSWFNSNEALKVAEESGGKQFRTNNSNFHITASLGEAVVPNSSPFWYIKYSTDSDKNNYVVFNINAVTGAVSKYPE
jgi:hypothetical protein